MRLVELFPGKVEAVCLLPEPELLPPGLTPKQTSYLSLYLNFTSWPTDTYAFIGTVTQNITFYQENRIYIIFGLPCAEKIHLLIKSAIMEKLRWKSLPGIFSHMSTQRFASRVSPFVEFAASSVCPWAFCKICFSLNKKKNETENAATFLYTKRYTSVRTNRKPKIETLHEKQSNIVWGEYNIVGWSYLFCWCKLPHFLVNKTDKLDLLSIYSDHKVAVLLFQQHFIDYRSSWIIILKTAQKLVLNLLNTVISFIHNVSISAFLSLLY